MGRRRRKGLLGLAVFLAVAGCDPRPPMTAAGYCRRVSAQLETCFRDYLDLLKSSRPGSPSCDPYGRDIEAQYQILIERPMGPTARRIVGYIHLKGVAFAEHAVRDWGESHADFVTRNTAALKEIAAVCEGIPETLE